MLIRMENLFLLICYCLSNINAYIEEEGYHCGVTGQSEKPPIGYELLQITNVHKLKTSPDTTRGLKLHIDYTSINMFSDTDKKTYDVSIGSKTVTCAKGDTIKEVEGYTGNFTCNPYERICTGTKDCNNLYECAMNESLPIDYLQNSQRLTIQYIMLVFVAILLL